MKWHHNESQTEGPECDLMTHITEDPKFYCKAFCLLVNRAMETSRNPGQPESKNLKTEKKRSKSE